VAVDQHECSIRQFSGEQRVGVSDFGQHAAERVLLLWRMQPPVARIWPQVGSADSAKFFDAVADLHDG
jgi:hypothetical protein